MGIFTFCCANVLKVYIHFWVINARAGGKGPHIDKVANIVSLNGAKEHILDTHLYNMEFSHYEYIASGGLVEKTFLVEGIP